MSAKNAIATITTASHLAQTLAVAESVSGKGNYDFKVLVTDAFDARNLPAQIGGMAISYHTTAELQNDPTAAKIIAKYTGDQLRWSLKSVFIKYWLLNDYDFCLYFDNDLFFEYKKNLFFFEELENASVLLCPHWRIKDPALSADWFRVNFTDGVYNAGFVGASEKGIPAMQWWAEACAYRCEKDHAKGLHDDQKYLDLLPAAFENVAILKHRGCNVAYWNKQENKRSVKNGQVLINDTWPLVFVHFTPELIREIEKGNEPALENTYRSFQQLIAKYKKQLAGV